MLTMYINSMIGKADLKQEGSTNPKELHLSNG